MSVKEKLRGVCVHDLLVIQNENVVMVVEEGHSRGREVFLGDEESLGSSSDLSSQLPHSHREKESQREREREKDRESKGKSIGEQLCMKIVGEKVRHF